MAKIEEMERLLREAQAEKQRLLEHRVIVTQHAEFIRTWLFDVIDSLDVPCAGA